MAIPSGKRFHILFFPEADFCSITIFGHSAGSTSVDFWPYAWAKDPIVAGLIAQSGTAIGLPGNVANDDVWWAISKGVGCGEKSGGIPKSLQCMRQKPALELMSDKGIGQVGAAGKYSTIVTFWPVVDERTVFSDIWDREAKGQYAKIPLITGDAAAEGNIIIGAAKIVFNWAKTQTSSLAQNANKVAPAFTYLENSENGAVASLRYILKFIEDGVFNCPAASATASRAKFGVPVWRYHHTVEWANQLWGGMGSYHISDVGITLGTVARQEGLVPNEPNQDATIHNVMTAWATFAKDPVNGLTKLGWPKYSPTGKFLGNSAYE